jgi:hypothetical protein
MNNPPYLSVMSVLGMVLDIKWFSLQAPGSHRTDVQEIFLRPQEKENGMRLSICLLAPELFVRRALNYIIIRSINIQGYVRHW